MDMLTFSEAWIKESAERAKIDPLKICTFGIKPLDDALYGICRNDLIVIGADSASGKSQLALDMAIHNALNNKKVALYFIEGGAGEAMARMKWKIMCDHYYTKYRDGTEIDYRKWRMNMSEDADLMQQLEEETSEMWTDRLDGNLFLYDFDKTFKIGDLLNSLGLVGKADLIIVDHLQYFDISNPKSELQEMGEILKKIKEITIFQSIPVVLISHLRKKDKDRGLPDQDDFYGTSNIAKISNISITICQNKVGEDFFNGIYPTFFRIVKSRTKISPNVAMLCNFEIKKQKYSEEYEVWAIGGRDPKILNKHQLPKWARVRNVNETPIQPDWNE